MKKICEESSIHGVKFFENSRNKLTRYFGSFLFLLTFCALGFYAINIYQKLKVNPIVGTELKLIPSRDVPFPAVTICNPIFSRNNSPNLREIFKNPLINLTIDQQNSLAANIQSCAPNLASKVISSCPLRDHSAINQILRNKFLAISDSFIVCVFGFHSTKCDRLLNYVLTDYGYCFSYNLQGFQQIFNSMEIAEEFKSYERTNIRVNYDRDHLDHKKIVDDENDDTQWSLESGYKEDSDDVQPVRAIRYNILKTYAVINASDLSNMCPAMKNHFYIFYHMPNEILTPFHKPEYFQSNSMKEIYLRITRYKADDNLRNFAPQNRNCYFEGEKQLKFFKSYTKTQCEFECLANFTLKSCSCVKFSMPRDNWTPICDLDKVSCYLRAQEKWSQMISKCNCLHSCTYIKYDVSYRLNKESDFSNTPVSYYKTSKG